MIRLKLWILLFCSITILLDKFSFVSKVRDYLSVYVEKQTASVVFYITNYPKLLLLQKANQQNLLNENVQLKQQLEKYSALLKQQTNLDEDMKSIDSMTKQSKMYNHYSVIIARAVIDINYLVSNKILIDKGFDGNIAIGDSVINQFGVIGQINSVNKQNAQVTLITNPDFKIYLQTATNKDKMLAQGIGNNKLIVKYIGKNVLLKEGDILYTTGLDDVYPANLPVVKINKIFIENNGFNSAICSPIVDFNKMQYLVVLKHAYR